MKIKYTEPTSYFPKEIMDKYFGDTAAETAEKKQADQESGEKDEEKKE